MPESFLVAVRILAHTPAVSICVFDADNHRHGLAAIEAVRTPKENTVMILGRAVEQSESAETKTDDFRSSLN